MSDEGSGYGVERAADAASGRAAPLDEILDAIDVGLILLDPPRSAVVSINVPGKRLLAAAGAPVDFDGLRRLFLPAVGDWTIPTGPTRSGTLRLGATLVGYNTYPAGDGLICIVARDVTERARLESIAQAVNIMDHTGYIFSCIRHEIGNPLNSIKTILSVLDANLDSYPRPALADNLRRCLGEVQRIETLLRSLKNFSLYEHPAPELLELPSFMEQFLRLVQRQLEGRKIAVSTAFADDARLAFVDPRALTQVMLNVVVNAMDALAGRESPRIEIAATRSGEYVLLKVADNGVGITPEQRRNLFRPFYTSKPHGTGLGLVIVRKLLTKMNGHIDVEGRPGAGATATLAIPAHPEAPARPMR
ncbi:MAG: HAMP domain-containing sensor histidine kinase [Candidatus Polarisedimenticolia bacterium]|nr:HAMP domain-containing histidine kinase [bacterium]